MTGMYQETVVKLFRVTPVSFCKAVFVYVLCLSMHYNVETG